MVCLNGVSLLVWSLVITYLEPLELFLPHRPVLAFHTPQTSLPAPCARLPLRDGHPSRTPGAVFVLTPPLPGNPVWAVNTQSPNARTTWGECETDGTPWQSGAAVCHRNKDGCGLSPPLHRALSFSKGLSPSDLTPQEILMSGKPFSTQRE